MFGLDQIYWVLINSTVSFVYLFIISKILGKKQVAQLEFIDYVVGISLGSIAADFIKFFFIIFCHCHSFYKINMVFPTGLEPVTSP